MKKSCPATCNLCGSGVATTTASSGNSYCLVLIENLIYQESLFFSTCKLAVVQVYLGSMNVLIDGIGAMRLFCLIVSGRDFRSWCWWYPLRRCGHC